MPSNIPGSIPPDLEDIQTESDNDNTINNSTTVINNINNINNHSHSIDNNSNVNNWPLHNSNPTHDSRLPYVKSLPPLLPVNTSSSLISNPSIASPNSKITNDQFPAISSNQIISSSPVTGPAPSSPAPPQLSTPISKIKSTQVMQLDPSAPSDTQPENSMEKARLAKLAEIS